MRIGQQTVTQLQDRRRGSTIAQAERPDVVQRHVTQQGVAAQIELFECRGG